MIFARSTFAWCFRNKSRSHTHTHTRDSRRKNIHNMPFLHSFSVDILISREYETRVSICRINVCSFGVGALLRVIEALDAKAAISNRALDIPFYVARYEYNSARSMNNGRTFVSRASVAKYGRIHMPHLALDKTHGRVAIRSVKCQMQV